MPEMSERCNTIEESYEFMLAYAAQGLPGEEGHPSREQVREFLHRLAEALDGLAENCATLVKQQGRDPTGRSQAFFAVLDRDARDSLAAIELVLAQPAISSQLIDNLNASVHLRALLTDVFLIGEVLRAQNVQAKPVVMS